MEILIFANKNEKKLLQQCLDWSKQSHINFEMTFVNSEKKMKQFLKKNQLIVSIDKDATNVLKKLKYKHINLKTDWYSGVKNVSF